jgi:hypothetical protein
VYNSRGRAYDELGKYKEAFADYSHAREPLKTLDKIIKT